MPIYGPQGQILSIPENAPPKDLTKIKDPTAPDTEDYRAIDEIVKTFTGIPVDDLGAQVGDVDSIDYANTDILMGMYNQFARSAKMRPTDASLKASVQVSALLLSSDVLPLVLAAMMQSFVIGYRLAERKIAAASKE